MDALDDFDVAGATTEVAVKRAFDFLCGGVWVFVQQGVSGDDHTGRAEPALDPARIGERRLNRVGRMDVPDARTRDDLPADGRTSQHLTGVDRSAVQQDQARATFSCTTAIFDFGASVLS